VRPVQILHLGQPEQRDVADVADHNHSGMAPDADMPSSVSATLSASSLTSALPGWALMSIAMMVPATLPAVRHVARNSLRVRRSRAMAVYVASYVAVWTAFGAVVLGVLALARGASIDERVLLASSLGVAGAWQLTPNKRRALFACRWTIPLPPSGPRADAACARYALQQAARCIAACWALMVVMAVVGHASLIWMAGLTALIVGEELPLVGWRLAKPAGVALALAAGAVVLAPV
jgi:predicted metal-binding membrane protein